MNTTLEKFNPTPRIVAATLIMAGFLAGVANGATLSIDDGRIYVSSRIAGGVEGLILNRFQATVDVQSISRVKLAFGSDSATSTSFDIILFSDPDGNGIPDDSIQLARDTVSTPATINPGVFVEYRFASPVAIPVGDNFFIGIVTKTGEVTLGSDFYGGFSSFKYLGGSDPTGDGILQTFTSFIDYHDPMIRAVGSVPEPSSMLLCGLGLFGIGIRRRVD